MTRPTFAAGIGLALGLMGACGDAGDGRVVGEPPSPNEVDAGVAPPTRCSGTIEVAGQEFVRVESESCYVTRIADGVPADCVPVKDRTLRDRLQDQVNSCDAWVDFVIARAPTRSLPASCDALLFCCNSREQLSRRQPCEDVVDNLPVDVDDETAGAQCAEALAPRCGDGSELPGGNSAAASGESEMFALCCYTTCGHDYCH